ncbi:hypothetical protein UFOVP410_183 [uncultured Caudovirales phage]|uniref:Uncharacterized protein n=1 Tax=uncultured Caudovirales phage TaxID=2100421 RepID=A0A6J5M3I3_9CAUD|nr:hypothetical protein UFOVP410_183 [uncultured Caudovirales phage]
MGKYLGRETPYGMFDTQDLSSALNGTLVTFNLTYKVSSAASVLVVYAGDVLQPEVDYNVVNGGTQITFDTAYPNGLSLYITYLGRELSTTSREVKNTSNSFSTSLSPSSGTLSIDASGENCILGALASSVTTWAFTNFSLENSKSVTVEVVLQGNTSYTYGDACSVNGTSISGGIRWSGGSAPTSTSNTDIIKFNIIRDSTGSIRVFGSAITNIS